MPEKRKDLIWIIRISLAIAAGLLVYFMFMTVFIPVSRYKIEIPEEKSKSDKIFRSTFNWQDSANDSIAKRAVELISKESFLLARLGMTKTDSISMAVSLKDSTVELVVQGVTIYRAKIQQFQVSHAFTKSDPFLLAQWLSKTFTVNTYYSSIAKVPVLYKKAPKDTIEAMIQPEIDPLKDDLAPVYYTLNLDRNLKLNFEQSEPSEKGFAKQVKDYKRQIKALNRKEIFEHLLKFEPLEFIPEINIFLDKKSARVIYRALPVDALVAIQLK